MTDLFLVPAAMIGAMSLAGAASMAHTHSGPVDSVTEPVPNGVRITVVGRPATTIEASNALQVGSNPAGNRSTQRGSVRVKPGVPVTMMTATLGNNGSDGWTARLRSSRKARRHTRK